MGVIQEVSAGRPARPLLAALDLSPCPGKRFPSWTEFLESRWVDRDSPCFPEENWCAHLLLDIRESMLQMGKVG